MKKGLFVDGVVFSFLSAMGGATENGEINLNKMLKPAPLSGKFQMDDWYIWCGAVIKGEDGKYNMFYSRWPRKYGHMYWVTGSEIAHAVGDSPFGPWTFKDVALPPRGAEFWDGSCTHNPTVHKFDGKYYLYYTGNTGDNKITQGLNFIHRNNQRIGVAVADSPNGPWKRFDKPAIDVSADPAAPDAIAIANPSVTKMNDGRYLMVYKAVAGQGKPPFYGPVVHLAAIADKPEGPFVKRDGKIFEAVNKEHSHFPAEDPYIWNQDGTYYAVVKDMRGAFSNAGRSLALFYSKDGFDWKLAKHPLVSILEINWADGTKQKVGHLERPQLIIEDGKPIAIIFAADDLEPKRLHSFNLIIPLDFEAGLKD